MFCSWIALLATYSPHLPVVLYGVVVLTAGLSALFLPETSKFPLPDSIEECEDIKLSKLSCKKKTAAPSNDVEC